MASGKGKQSKNSRTSKKAVQEFIKKVRPKKETILIELTEEVMCEIYKDTNIEKDLVDQYKEKKVLGIVSKFGKKYLKVDNT